MQQIVWPILLSISSEEFVNYTSSLAMRELGAIYTLSNFCLHQQVESTSVMLDELDTYQKYRSLLVNLEKEMTRQPLTEGSMSRITSSTLKS